MDGSFGCLETLHINGIDYQFLSLGQLSKTTTHLPQLPYSIRVLLENLLRSGYHGSISADSVTRLAAWGTPDAPDEIPFMPARVLMQDFTGVPAMVDLAAMRSEVARHDDDPLKINPLVPVDLVIDHSLQVDEFGSNEAYTANVSKEYERNSERYRFLKWAQTAFQNVRIVPPGMGICHQVNLEFLSPLVHDTVTDGQHMLYPDTCIGTDSHTTMINGLGVMGWGVGGIEAEAVMLGQHYVMPCPDVVGVRLTGSLTEGTTATDLVLTIVEMLRKLNVVGKFVEFFGSGLSSLSLADRATIANMAPEYGATMGYFPVDEQTISYMRQTGRPEQTCQIAEAYFRAQGLFVTADSPEPVYTQVVELSLSSVKPSLAGPKRPQDRVELSGMKSAFEIALTAPVKERGFELAAEHLADISEVAGQGYKMRHGDVVIAAITSCTNTSNPSVLVGAGLLAQKALALGLKTKPWVKTSLTPGSRAVTEYLKAAGVMPALDALGFNVVGYGCATCIGNSGPLAPEIVDAIKAKGIVAASVLSGNRNFEGRVSPHTRANYLASPLLVVAYALAGNVTVDLLTEPIGTDQHGKAVYLKDIWPSQKEISDACSSSVRRELFEAEYAKVFLGDDFWQALQAPTGDVYQWDPNSTYIQEPPYFLNAEGNTQDSIDNLRPLAVFGDSITTDHISPAGSFADSTPAGVYLQSLGVNPADFNSYGSRRGNHNVMMRGTFANIRIKNQLLDGVEGGFSVMPDGSQAPIFNVAMACQQAGIPLMVIAGKEYGTGSSRDWAAKGPVLLGMKLALAESFERIHRSNLIGMGVLPVQFLAGQNRESLGLTGTESYSICGLSQLAPKIQLTMQAKQTDGSVKTFNVLVRIDTPAEVDYYRSGGILQMVINKLTTNNA
ncbi:MAG: aconitate hydratase AcnA [Armatimonadota bacterium]